MISLSNLNDRLDVQNILHCRFFLCITLNILCHFFLVAVSDEKSAVNLMVPPFSVVFFSFFAFNILSLSFIFVSLITMFLSVFLLGFILPRTLCASWTWLIICFPMLGKFSAIISYNISCSPFSLSSPVGPYNVNVRAVNVVQEVS